MKHIVVDVLGENLTLTGRGFDLIVGFGPSSANLPIFGYGYGNAAVAMYVGVWKTLRTLIMETLVNYGVKLLSPSSIWPGLA